MATPTGNQLICTGCGHGGQETSWSSYVCAVCGQLNEPLYRAEHVRPRIAARLTSAGIRAEYRAAGLPMTPLRLTRADLMHHRRSY